MNNRIPTVPAVMTGVLGIFLLVASLGTVLPGFVHDRMPEQFVPTCEWLLTRIMQEPTAEQTLLFAHLSQVIIAAIELIAGVILLAAAFLPRHRLALTNFGVGLSIGLFGTFMLTMFAMHDKSLPAWNQYPAILAWLGVTWLVVALTDANASRK